MSDIELMRWFASVMTIISATCVALKISDRVSFWGFIGFSLASLTWILIGILDDKSALTAQNIVLTLINFYGIYRYGFSGSKEDQTAS